jgi:hypothetical protein
MFDGRCPRLPRLGAGIVASAGAEPVDVRVDRARRHESAAADVHGFEVARRDELIDEGRRMSSFVQPASVPSV